MNMKGVVIDPNMKNAVVNILVQPAIRSWGDACSFVAANRGRIKPVVLKVLIAMFQDQQK